MRVSPCYANRIESGNLIVGLTPYLSFHSFDPLSARWPRLE